jgi:hypothetical protein
LSCYPVNQWVMRQDIPGEASIRYGKLLTRLTGPRKSGKMGRKLAFCAWRDPSNGGRAVAFGAEIWGRSAPALRLSLRNRHLVNRGTWASGCCQSPLLQPGRSARRQRRPSGDQLRQPLPFMQNSEVDSGRPDPGTSVRAGPPPAGRISMAAVDLGLKIWRRAVSAACLQATIPISSHPSR